MANPDKPKRKGVYFIETFGFGTFWLARMPAHRWSRLASREEHIIVIEFDHSVYQVFGGKRHS